MASEWIETTLGEVVRLQRGHDLPSQNRREGSIPILGSFGLTGWHDSARCKGPGITVGRSGASIGVVSYSKCDFWPLNTALYVTDFLGNDPKYCYYFLKTLNLATFDSGSAQPSLNRNYVYHLPVCIPKPIEQRAIASLLDVLDNRIVGLNAQNESSEKIARAMFTSWFVDFDPVRAKAAGREPEGMDAATAALFPEDFTVEEFGLLPANFQRVGIREICRISSGKRPSERSNTDSDVFRVPLYGGAGPMGFVREDSSEPTTILTGRVGTLGTVHLVRPPFWASDNTLMVQPRNMVDIEMIYFSVQDMPLKNLNRGSTQPLLTQTDLGNQTICYATQDVRSAFHEIASPILGRMEHNKRIAETLAEVRDTLLPRLISGKLRVPEAEKLVEAAL